jgi:hypothetical protein
VLPLRGDPRAEVSGLALVARHRRDSLLPETDVDTGGLHERVGQGPIQFPRRDAQLE